METIRNYNAPSLLFFGVAPSFVIGILAILAQWIKPDFPQQGLDLIDSFFIYALLAQFTHLSWVHLALNLAGLALITWGFAAYLNRMEWVLIQAAALIWVPFYVLAIEPLDWYCGLSGALHFQFSACLILTLYRSPAQWRKSWPLWVLGLGLVAKLWLEWNSGQTTDVWVGGPIAVEAHRGGVLGGVLMATVLLGFSRLQRVGTSS